MSATHGLTPSEVALSVAQSLEAALRDDVDAVETAMAPLFRKDVCGWDWFSWTIGMIALTTRETPRPGPDVKVEPVVYIENTRTGETSMVPLDEAPPEFPKASAVVLRLSAHFLNDDRDAARAIWSAILQDETARMEAAETLGPIEDDDEPSLIADVLRTSLEAATVATKARKGRLQ